MHLLCFIRSSGAHNNKTYVLAVHPKRLRFVCIISRASSRVTALLDALMRNVNISVVGRATFLITLAAQSFHLTLVRDYQFIAYY